MTGGRHDARDAAGTERLINAREAAALLGVSERTVRRKIAAGELVSVKAGAARLIPVTALTLSPHDDTGDKPGVSTVTSPRHDTAALDVTPLATLIERQAQEIARLSAELATARERLRALDAAQAHPAAPGAAHRAETGREPPRPWWKFWGP